MGELMQLTEGNMLIVVAGLVANYVAIKADLNKIKSDLDSHIQWHLNKDTKP